MKTVIGYTITDLMSETGKSRTAIESFISRHKIEPLTNEVIYPVEILELLLKARRGRPKKPAEPEPENPAKGKSK